MLVQGACLSKCMWKNFVLWFKKHKALSYLFVIVILGGGYFLYQKLHTPTVETRYVLSPVVTGTLTVSVSGSGQVSASSQVDIKSEGSGKALAILVKNGQEVKTNDIIARLDAKDAYKSVRDATLNLQTAQLSLQKLQAPTDANSIFSAQNSLEQAKNDLSKLKISQENDLQTAQDQKQKSLEAISSAYEDAFNTLSDGFLDFPTNLADLYTMLYSKEIAASDGAVSGRDNVTALFDSTQPDENQKKIGLLRNIVEKDYVRVKDQYDKSFDAYKATTRFSNQDTIDALLKQTLEMTKTLAQTEKDVSNLLDTWVQYRTDQNVRVFSQVTTYQTELATTIAEVNSHLSALSAISSTIVNNKNSVISNDRAITKMQHDHPLEIISSEQNIKEKEAALAELQAGVDPLDLKTEQLSLQQRRNALADAQLTLANYTIKAPFNGTIATVATRLGESVSSGSVVATIITKDHIATIPLNEIDVAKIKLGQKVTLTFDSVEGLTLTGQVVDIDTIGTVSQGVVNYNVKIGFDTEDARIKPGMSVSASIITDVKQNVLLIPNAAVKTDQSGSYVQIIPNITEQNAGGQAGVTTLTPPLQKNIQVGLQNDTVTEVFGDIKEGDMVVTRTILPTATVGPATSSILPTGGGNRGGFGAR